MGAKIKDNKIVFEDNPRMMLALLGEKTVENMENAELEEYIALLASKLPAPGGGAAAAVNAAQGFALASMVCNFSIGKPKFADYEDRLNHIRRESMLEAKRMLELIDLDEDNFVPLSKAYGIKAETDEEKAEKTRIMDEALGTACLAPLEMLQGSCYGLTLLMELKDISSALIVSDIGVGAENFRSAADSAKLNVMINAKMLKNEALKQEMYAYIDKKTAESMGLYQKIMEFVYGKL